MTPLPDKLLELAKRLRRSLKMDRTSEAFYGEVDEAAHELEAMAIDPQISRETVCERTM